ncbi:hypothetical protein NESM_000179800 [Novymonas esmeraldas]|uniref:Cilia- and flagella-associated protein 61 N-terminal domain-containing protein n=1 Tax=Novymonas esmeraldas TaxID=1808958 RepID=A0AAW0F692_9TRYP
MVLAGSLPGVRCRRSQPRDAAQLTALLHLCDVVPEGIPTPAVFHLHTRADVATLIQTAYLSVTAVRDVKAGAGGQQTSSSSPGEEGEGEDEVVVGFIVLSDELAPASLGHSVAAGSSSSGGEVGGESAVTMEQTTVFNEDMRDAVGGATLENSLWLRMLIAPPSDAVGHTNSASTTATTAAAAAATAAVRATPYSSEEMAMDLLRVAFGTMSGIEHIFMSPGAAFSCLEAITGVAPLSTKDVVGSVLPASSSASRRMPARKVLHLSRAVVLPPLTIRQGRVEDYDDTVSLLVAGGPGVITELPPHFFLEEILQDQDTYNKVIVAEDAVTHEVVGVACLRQLAVEEQQHTARLYNTDALDRLRHVSLDGAGAGVQFDGGLSCTVSIFFLYFNPRFDHSAYQLLPSIFREFPTCDYATLRLPHTLPSPEPMVLERFQYAPLRRYQPHNARGEVVPAPDALWVCPKVSMEMDHGVQARVELLSSPRNVLLRSKVLSQFTAPAKTSPSPSVSRAGRPAGAGVHAVLHQQQGRGGAGGVLPGFPGCSAELLSAIQEDLDTASPAASPASGGGGGGGGGGDAAAAAAGLSRAVFALTWGVHSAGGGATGAVSLPAVAGLVSVQPLSVGEMYALRANYDLDRFLTFNASGGFDYSATDTSLTAEEGPLRYRSSELPGLIVRFVYIRPVFRQHLRFFLREVLRVTGAAVLLALTSTDAALCQTAIASFVFAPPRRVVEVHDDDRRRTPKHGEEGLVSTLISVADVPEVNDVTPAMALDKADAAHTSLALGSLFFTTRRFLGDERVRVHARVVVVGASATALCLLYELLSIPYLDFLNLTVVATDGMPLHPNQRQGRQWQVDGMELLEREYVRLRLGDGLANPQSFCIGANVVRVVQGTLIDIDTTMKFIHLENSMYEPYDQLLLATGRQYIVSPPIRALQQQEARVARGGVLAFSGEVAEDRLRHTLSELGHSVSGSIANVVVYGSGLDAVATLSTMVSVGFPAQRLVLCRPSTEQTPFTDAACGEAAMALFRALGVTVLEGYGVSRLEYDDDALTSVLLASLSFERKAGEAVELPCALIVCLEEKEIDRSVLTALAKRSIVFDGRVIVGSAYETSQPDVLAAGPVAMFTRRYGATEAFEAFNPRDIGRDLARVLLARLGVPEFRARIATAASEAPTATTRRASADGAHSVSVSDSQVADNTSSSSATSLDASHGRGKRGPVLPTYASPVSRRVRLPCGYQYTSTVRGSAAFDATKCIPLQFSSTDMSSVPLDDVHPSSNTAAAAREAAKTPAWREMMTLFVHAQHRTIDGIVYVGNGTPEVHNYRAMIGMPESLFHLQYRYAEVATRRDGGDDFDPTTAAMLHAGGGGGARAATAGVLTVPPRNGQFDLVSYLRLPTLKPLLTDRFFCFFWQLQREVQAAEEVVTVRARVLAAQQATGTLSPADAALRVAELTDTRQAFRHKTQLALLKYLHESKDTRPQDMYLPSIEKQMAERRRAVG